MNPSVVLILSMLASSQVVGGFHGIAPVGIDISPAVGVWPDGVPEFTVNGELLEIEYQGVPAGIELSTSLIVNPFGSPLRYNVTVTNLTQDLAENVVLTIENYGVFYGDPSAVDFVYETVWNPPALAGGEVPAYLLGSIPSGESAAAVVDMLPGWLSPIFDGSFDAESLGFNSGESVPGFSDASVLLVPEPTTLLLFGSGLLLLVRRQR